MGGGGMGYPRGGGYPQQPSHPDGKKVLQILAGNRWPLLRGLKKEPIDQIYDQIEDELRNQYNLGFSPDQADSEGSYHKIQLTTTHKDLIVQVRDGYYAEK